MCVIDTVLFLNSKHSTAQATRKKTNSVPDKTRTGHQNDFKKLEIICVFYLFNFHICILNC